MIWGLLGGGVGLKQFKNYQTRLCYHGLQEYQHNSLKDRKSAGPEICLYYMF